MIFMGLRGSSAEAVKIAEGEMAAKIGEGDHAGLGDVGVPIASIVLEREYSAGVQRSRWGARDGMA